MREKGKIAKSATMIALFTLISKGMGFIREIIIASKYGSGLKSDTYFAAMTATVLIMGTIGGALSTTLIPIFSEIRGINGKDAQKKYLNNILNISLLITIAIGVLAYIISPLVIKIVAKGFEGEQFLLAVKLNRIGLPIIIFLGITYVLSAYLQSNEIFTPHALMGIPYNLVFLIGLLGFAKGQNIEYLMLISVLAALTQILIQIPALLRTHYKYRPRIDLADPYLKKALTLIMPVLIGSAVSQINVIVDKTLASELPKGSISALTYSSRMNEMIISVFVAAIATVIFPMLSKAFSKGKMEEIRSIFKKSVNIILLITVPATLGIMLLGHDLVRLFFERDAFTRSASLMTSGALFYYSIGLVASALRLMLNKMFYSFQDTRTPMINGAIAVIVNVILNIFLVKYMAHEGLALATSISAIVTTILLFIDLRARIGQIGMKSILISFIKISLASGIMGVVVYSLYFKLFTFISGPKIYEILSLILSVLVGMVVYFTITKLLKVKEVNILLSLKKN